MIYVRDEKVASTEFLLVLPKNAYDLHSICYTDRFRDLASATSDSVQLADVRAASDGAHSISPVQ